MQVIFYILLNDYPYDKLLRNEYLKAFTILGFLVLLFSLFKVLMLEVGYHFF